MHFKGNLSSHFIELFSCRNKCNLRIDKWIEEKELKVLRWIQTKISTWYLIVSLENDIYWIPLVKLFVAVHEFQ